MSLAGQCLAVPGKGGGGIGSLLGIITIGNVYKTVQFKPHNALVVVSSFFFFLIDLIFRAVLGSGQN